MRGKGAKLTESERRGNFIGIIYLINTGRSSHPGDSGVDSV